MDQKNLELYVQLPWKTITKPDELTTGEPCYMAYNLDLSGCMAHGESIEEAIEMLTEVRREYLKTLIESNLEIPLQWLEPVEQSSSFSSASFSSFELDEIGHEVQNDFEEVA